MRTLPLLLIAACTGAPAPVEVLDAALAPVDRTAFNAAAVELALPLFKKRDGSVVAYRSTLPVPADVDAAVARIEAHARTPATVVGLDPADAARRRSIRAELAAGRPTLLESDFSQSSDADKTFVRHMLRAADAAEVLFARQNGVHGLGDRIPADDTVSRALFERNQGPWCDTRDCVALADPPPRTSEIYPADIQSDPGFCDTLAAEHPDVMQPFMTAVRGPDGTIAAVPYSERWPEELAALATALRAAADALDPSAEAPLQAYLRAAAEACTTNDWFAADAKWAAMNQRNSKWYVRVGPDEVYWDTCGAHAGFHLQLAVVNLDGLVWQDKLDPVKQDMEAALAELAGPPYQARQVGFELPEFIEIVVNAGDARSPRGATVGQSLPNWGPVSEAGGRTVAMTNIAVDPDSIAARTASMEAVWCPETAARWPSDPAYQLGSTVLHEAAHNLGPSGEYRVDGKTDLEAFGGPLASMMEELKCQSAAMYLTSWLADKGITDPDEVHATHMGDLGWALGQISSGIFDPGGRPKAYPQLAAVQIGRMLDAGAITWEAEKPAANGTDVGCLQVDPDALPAAVDGVAKEVFSIKARAAKAEAEALRDAYTRDAGEFARLRATIEERFGRQARPSVIYRVVLDEAVTRPE